MELICFVILHYKDNETTERCIQSILTMEQQERILIVVIDNDINEDSQKRIELQSRYKHNPNIYVIQITENGGFSYANNVGYCFAKEELGASFILVLNNDIEFIQKDFIRKLDDSYRLHHCHILGPDIVKKSNGEHQNPMDTRIRTRAEAEYTIKMNRFALKWYFVLYPVLYLQSRYEEKMRIKQKKENETFYEDVHKKIVPFGACLIFTPEFVKQEAQAFEPETQFYYEEYILTLRCERKQYEIVYDPGMRVLHESGEATKKSYGRERERMRFLMEKTMKACKIYLEYLK